MEHDDELALWMERYPPPHCRMSIDVGDTSKDPYANIDYIYILDERDIDVTIIMPEKYAKCREILALLNSLKRHSDRLCQNVWDYLENNPNIPLIFAEKESSKRELKIDDKVAYSDHSSDDENDYLGIGAIAIYCIVRYNIIKLAIINGECKFLAYLLKEYEEEVIISCQNVFSNCDRKQLVKNLNNLVKLNYDKENIIQFLIKRNLVSFPKDLLLSFGKGELRLDIIATFINMGFNWNLYESEDYKAYFGMLDDKSFREIVKSSNRPWFYTKEFNTGFHPMLNWTKHSAGLFLPEFKRQMKTILLACIRWFGGKSVIYNMMRSDLIWIIGQTVHVRATRLSDFVTKGFFIY